MSEYEDLSPDFKDMLMNKMNTDTPFWSLLDMELVDIRKGWAKVKLPFAEKLLHPMGVVHGGAIFSVADSAVAMALVGMTRKGETIATVEMKINYLKPINGGEIVAEAKIVNKGSRIALGEVEVTNGKGDLVAKALATYMIIAK